MAPLLCVDGASLPPVAAAGRVPGRYLSELVEAGDAIDGNALVPLLGLGPGLTPSGLLCGVLITLHLVGRTPLRRRDLDGSCAVRVFND